MATARHVFRFADKDLALMDQLYQMHGLSNRSVLLRWLLYREARSQGILNDAPDAELRKGRPKEKHSIKNKKMD